MLFPNTWVPKAASGLLTEHSGLVEEGTADPHRSAGPVHRSSAPDDHPSALQSHSTLWDRKLLEKLIFRDGGSAFDSTWAPCWRRRSVLASVWRPPRIHCSCSVL